MGIVVGVWLGVHGAKKRAHVISLAVVLHNYVPKLSALHKVRRIVFFYPESFNSEIRF